MVRFGKSTIQRALIEQLLDSGKTVVVLSPTGAVKKKRIGHLTSHEVLKPKPIEPGKIFFDEIQE